MVGVKVMVIAVLLLLQPCFAMQSYRLPKYNSPPIARQLTRTCYDSIDSKLWLFGGFPEGGNYYDDLWSFDLTTNLWAEIVRTARVYPDERKSHSCFVDEEARLLYIFGGESNLGILNDMWTYNLESSQVPST
jgi:hypothetical protein